MDILVAILITVIGAILGAALSASITIHLSYRKYGLGPNITGTWYTIYQTADLPGRPWVKEDVDFWLKTGRLRFKTYNNERNDAIEGDAELFGKNYLIGRWRQVDRRSSNHGVFMLTIAPSGRLMYGFWSGTSESGEKRFGGWINSRERADLDEGKSLLAQVTAVLSEHR